MTQRGNSLMPTYLLPYRVEWRHDLTTPSWQLIQSYEKREDADARLEQAPKDWGGQGRIISQHVIEAKGLREGR